MPRQLVCITGWGSNGQSLAGLASLLDAANASVVLTSVSELYQRGQGEGAERYLSGLSQQLTEAQSRTNQYDEDSPVSLIGWSMGGMVAQQWALRHPQRCSRLLLLATTASFIARPPYRAGLPLEILRETRAGLEHNPADLLARFFGRMYESESAREKLVAAKVTAALDLGLPALVDGLRYLEATDLTDSIRQISTPTLVIHGKHDAIIPWQAGAYLAQHLAQAELVLLETATHAFPENPETFTSNVAGEGDGLLAKIQTFLGC